MWGCLWHSSKREEPSYLLHRLGKMEQIMLYSHAHCVMRQRLGKIKNTLACCIPPPPNNPEVTLCLPALCMLDIFICEEAVSRNYGHPGKTTVFCLLLEHSLFVVTCQLAERPSVKESKEFSQDSLQLYFNTQELGATFCKKLSTQSPGHGQRNLPTLEMSKALAMSCSVFVCFSPSNQDSCSGFESNRFLWGVGFVVMVHFFRPMKDPLNIYGQCLSCNCNFRYLVSFCCPFKPVSCPHCTPCAPKKGDVQDICQTYTLLKLPQDSSLLGCELLLSPKSSFWALKIPSVSVKKILPICS